MAKSVRLGNGEEGVAEVMAVVVVAMVEVVVAMVAVVVAMVEVEEEEEDMAEVVMAVRPGNARNNKIAPATMTARGKRLVCLENVPQ